MGIIVIKVGSSIVTNDGGRVDTEIISKWVKQIHEIQKNHQNTHFVLVTSGAVAEGFRLLGFRDNERKNVTKRRVAAAVGQIELMRIYGVLFDQYEIKISQYLVTKNDFQNSAGKRNLLKGVGHLHRLGILPIFNENDCIAQIGENLGNNDVLGAYLSVLFSADKYIMLTDVNGLYNVNPKTNPEADIVPFYDFNAASKIATDSNISKISTGGMSSKIEAAEFCFNYGLSAYIGNGRTSNIISDIFSNSNKEKYTEFSKRSLGNSYGINDFIPSGSIYINLASEKWAEKNDWDLLVSGIEKITGEFDIGEAVSIKRKDGSIISYGIINYSSKDIENIVGKSNDEIEELFPKRKPFAGILKFFSVDEAITSILIIEPFKKGDIIKFVLGSKEKYGRALISSKELEKHPLKEYYPPAICEHPFTRDYCERIEAVSRDTKIPPLA